MIASSCFIGTCANKSLHNTPANRFVLDACKTRLVCFSLGFRGRNATGLVIYCTAIPAGLEIAAVSALCTIGGQLSWVGYDAANFWILDTRTFIPNSKILGVEYLVDPSAFRHRP